ncbi:MAG: PVC-type heme-binding CxxCH protein, partial [Isosphaeraceae bacterium]
YLKDTDGDHRADVRRKVFTGFGTQNEQGMLNNLTFALDHKIYGSTSVNGGLVRHVDRPDVPAISIDGKDFRFDPVTETLEALSGTVQFGTTFDDFGNRFLCSESRPLLHAVLPAEALSRNPYLPVTSTLDDVAGHPVPIFRISPLERWRRIRSARRIAHGERSASSAGASHHVIDAAAGVTVYRGSAYPTEYQGDVFVNDAQNNLIHRLKLSPKGVSFRASRVEEGTEFVRSHDNAFRPVNLLNAPDGTLHVLDMSREVIEAIHIPLDVVKHLDLRRGRDQGRIYRIAPRGFRSPPPPRLGSATTDQLVATLKHPDGWWRDTAHRLIFERQDQSAVGPLRALEGGPATRVLALWSLQGLNALTVEDLINASDDKSPEVVEHAVKLSAARLNQEPALLDRLLKLADSDAPRIRFAVAIALGGATDERVTNALAAIARRDSRDPWIRTVALASAFEHSDRLFAILSQNDAFRSSAEGQSMLEALAGVVGMRRRDAEVTRLLNGLARSDTPVEFRRRMVLSLGLGLKRAGAALPLSEPAQGESERLVAALIEDAVRQASQLTAGESSRLASIALLAAAPLARARGPLVALLDPIQTSAIQVAAIRALSGFNDPSIADRLLSRYRNLTPAARAEAIESLLSREPWTLSLLKASQAGRIDLAQVEPSRRDRLATHKNPEIAAMARDLFGPSPRDATRDALTSFAPALTLAGETARGASVFAKQCASCHKLGDQGHGVGPDLTTSQFSEPLALLTHILEPNRYVAPNHVEYVVSDRSGRIYNGLISSESPSSLTLRRAEGHEETILRSQIEELTSTGKSLMPEDFATKLSHQEAADLLAFLLAQRKSDAAPERLDVGTLPGLIEPDR